jgi:pyroglutamyl-peptidase
MRLSVLLTGFEPFGGDERNPSQDLVLALGRGQAPHPALSLACAVLPVDIGRVRGALAAAVARARPVVVLGFGQAAGRGGVELETRAFNVLDFRGEADNGGHRARGEPLHTGAPSCLHASLPLDALAARTRAAGHAIGLSHDAGRHLCNALLFELLYRHPRLQAAFVHVPALPEQVARRGLCEPSLSLDETLATVRALLAALPAVLDA